jgi:uroporphyrin-III C-methyltransferase/precorrin-2 dehydrogenase/sirohydrochlorin ferrochelatase
MGLTGLEKICASMIEHGRAADTPAALIQQGTHPQQRVFASTLRHLPALVARSEVSAPTMLIIGHVVTLREKLGWFDPSRRG